MKIAFAHAEESEGPLSPRIRAAERRSKVLVRVEIPRASERNCGVPGAFGEGRKARERLSS